MIRTDIEQMSSDYLLTNGCSFTYGTGIGPYPLTDEDIKSRWSSLVAEEFNLVDYNIGVPGSCNQRIFRTTFYHILAQKKMPKLAIIMLSDPIRTEVFRPQSAEFSNYDMAQVNYSSIGRFEGGLQDALVEYFSYIQTGERSLVHTMSYMLSLKYLFESKGIPYIITHYKNLFYNEVNRAVKYWGTEFNGTPPRMFDTLNHLINELSSAPHIKGFNEDTSFTTIINDKMGSSGFSIYSGGHPNADGHKLMSEWLIEYIRQNEISS